MTNTTFQAKQLEEIRRDRREARETFAATGATAEIGIVSNLPGHFTVNVINGPRKRNFENRPFASKIEAIRSFARENFGKGSLKKNANLPNGETFLVFAA